MIFTALSKSDDNLLFFEHNTGVGFQSSHEFFMLSWAHRFRCDACRIDGREHEGVGCLGCGGFKNKRFFKQNSG
jgi:hypothetical protein